MFGRRTLVLFTLALAALPLACGGDGLSPEAAVAEAATKTAKSETYRASFTGSMTGFGTQTLRMTGTGEFDAGGKRARMTVAYDIAGQEFELEMAMDLPLMYMRFPPEFGAQLPSGKSWIKFDLQNLGEQLGFDFQQLMQASQADPSQGLEYLRGVSDVETVGEESVRGVDTTHYQGVIDLRQVAKEFPDAKESIDRIIELTTVDRVPADVWVDGDGFVRRMRLDYQGMRFAPGQRGDMTMTMELYDFGAEVDVEPPPDDEVIDIQELLNQRKV